MCFDFHCVHDKIIDRLVNEDKIIIDNVRLYDIDGADFMVLCKERLNILYMLHAIFLDYTMSDAESGFINRFLQNAGSSVRAEFYNMDSSREKVVFDIDIFLK